MAQNLGPLTPKTRREAGESEPHASLEPNLALSRSRLKTRVYHTRRALPGEVGFVRLRGRVPSDREPPECLVPGAMSRAARRPERPVARRGRSRGGLAAARTRGARVRERARRPRASHVSLSAACFSGNLCVEWCVLKVDRDLLIKKTEFFTLETAQTAKCLSFFISVVCTFCVLFPGSACCLAGPFAGPSKHTSGHSGEVALGSKEVALGFASGYFF